MNNINDVRQRVTSIASKYGKIKNVRTIGESEKVLNCSFTNVKVKGEKNTAWFCSHCFPDIRQLPTAALACPLPRMPGNSFPRVEL